MKKGVVMLLLFEIKIVLKSDELFLQNIVIERIPDDIAFQISADAPCRIVSSMFSDNPQYGDCVGAILSNFNRAYIWAMANW